MEEEPQQERSTVRKRSALHFYPLRQKERKKERKKKRKKEKKKKIEGILS